MIRDRGYSIAAVAITAAAILSWLITVSAIAGGIWLYCLATP